MSPIKCAVQHADTRQDLGCQENATIVCKSSDYLNMQYADVDLQQYQIKKKHEPRQLHDAIDAEYAAAVKLTAKGGRRPVGFDAKSEKAQREAEGAATPDAMAALVRKSKKR